MNRATISITARWVGLRGQGTPASIIPVLAIAAFYLSLFVKRVQGDA